MDDSQHHERQKTTDSSSGATLRRPMQIVKKRSGPLEDALSELNSGSSSAAVSPTSPPPQQRTILQNVPVPQKLAATSSSSRRSSVTTTSPPSLRRKGTIKDKKDKEKKRSERWLLTRKTWKYMTDAGRKLIPEGAQNRAEDIPKIERHFHQVCANEPRFVLWRRKLSYPGATRNSKRRLKQLLSHTGQKTQTQESIEQEEARNADQIIDLLQSYLQLNEARKTTTLLGSKTVRPDQTASPSAQRPGSSGGGTGKQQSATGMMSSSVVGIRPGFLPSQQPRGGLYTLSEIEQLLERLRTLSRCTTCRPISVPLDCITPDLLEDKALLKQIYNELKKQQLHRILGKHAMRPSLPHATSLTSLFHFGGNSGGGKQQQDLHQQHHHLGIPPMTTIPSASTTTATTTAGITNNQKLKSTVLSSISSKNKGATLSGSSVLQQRQRKPPSTLDLTSSGQQQQIPVISIKKAPPAVERTYNSCGTQTSFIQLHEIKRLADDYKLNKREEAAAQAAMTAPTDDELSDKSGAIAPSATAAHRRKSSIDNEDVSQSVSDTIKRYLRMARKKSVHDDNANRFKRVNYDRNLRNIRAKGEINPPGMDEGNTKAIQTLDAWPVITLDFIRGNDCSDVLAEAHAEWRKSLDERIQKKLDYEEKLRKDDADKSYTGSSASVTAKVIIQSQQQKQSHSSCSSSSVPTSPTMDQQQTTTAAAMHQQHHGGGGGSGILQSGTQFLSNLWHGVGYHQQHHTHNDPATINSNSSLSSSLTNASSTGFSFNQKHIDPKNSQTMQKSKSSSNVGQFVSKKILKSRSKSQTRPSSPTLPKWTPAEKFTWTSENGARITLSDVSLQDLSEIEAKILQRVAIEKINELNIGINVTVPGDTIELGKTVKRRALTKKKAMTTSIFDIGKKEDKNTHFSVFGNSLENCVANDKKRQSNLMGTSSSERGSRNSIASLFRSSSSKVRSCESLPSSAFSVHQQAVDLAAAAVVGSTSGLGVGSGGGHDNINNSSAYLSGSGNLSSTTIPLMSRSQSDVRRASQDYDSDPIHRNSSSPPPPPTTAINVGSADVSSIGERQVPSFISACIRHLEEYGMHSVGLFRVSTSKKRVRQLREELDRNCTMTPLASIIDAGTCSHDVATLLKEFLRDLPEPLLCRSLYKAFLETQRIRNRRLQLEAISHLVKLLPPAHRDTLYALLRFLAHVAACSDDVTSSDGSLQISGNKMDSNNLATVFAPNVLRSTVTSNDPSSSMNVSEQEFMADAINVIRIMIDHYEELFRVPVDLVDAIFTHMFDTCPQQLNFLCEQRTNVDNNDEIDSASTNTPLSSPPSVSAMAGQSSQMFGNDFSTDLKTFEQTLKSTTSPATSTIPCAGQGTVAAAAAPVAPARKIYTRESVMHENAASGNDNNSINGSATNSARRRRSRPKYSDSDTAVHRLLFGGSCSSSSSDPSGPMASGHSITNEQQQLQKQKQISSELSVPSTAVLTSRRQSSPYILDKAAGVVTASLHIPVQMQGSAVASAYDDLDDVFYSHGGSGTGIENPQMDLSDIPYIEDAYGSLDLENFSEGFPITGSLSFGGAPSNYNNNNNKNNTKSTIHGKTTTTTEALSLKDNAAGGEVLPSKLKTFRMKPTLAGVTTAAAATIKTATKAAASSTISKNNGSGSKNATTTVSTLEPKLPTSISNIGGAILRSKTADFERLSLTAAASGGSGNNNNNSSSSATTLPQQLAGANTTNDRQRNTSNQTQTQPLYKRQAIISSAKRTTTATHK